MTFELVRQRNELRLRRARVLAVEEVTPAYRRIILGGEDLAGFDSPGADDHIKVFFPPFPDAPLELPTLGEGGVRADPGSLRPVAREYTPVSWDGSRATLTLDFVLHGDGVASSWAERAAVGNEVGIGGPRGSLTIDGEPAWWLVAGDLTALPAIRRHLAAVRPGVPVRAIVSVDDPADMQPLVSPGVLTATWVTADAPGDPSALLEVLRSTGRPDGDGFAFVAAEQSVVKPARAVLLDGWGLDADRIVVKGYWKRGEVGYHAPH